MVATEALGLPVVTVWLSQVATYVPRIIAAIFIVALGAVMAKLARKIAEGAARSATLPAHDRIGRLTEVAVLVAVGLVAVEQLGIEISLLTTVLLIVVAALFGGAALAFGLGGRDWIANVLSAHYVERLYQTGQTIRVGQFEGRILRITETVVVLETADGEVAVPAREFASVPSTLVLRKDPAREVRS
jgi:small-conductance mechanosensitive channel